MVTVPIEPYRSHERMVSERAVQSDGGQEKNMSIAQEVSTIGRAFVSGLKRILKEKLYGAYIYGAAAFPDAVPAGDIDFHVILESELTDSERSGLEALHESLSKQYPSLGSDLDGYYLLLADARRERPPRSQMWRRATDDSWALHRQHIRAGRHIVLYGPEPVEIYPPASWPEIEEALCVELDYVERHLHEHPGYCILNLCRLIYSFETKDVVVSKAQASDWACEALPEWKPLVIMARESYPDRATTEEMRFMLAEVDGLLEFARKRIEHARLAGDKEGR
jgi:hypothetical protein